MAFIGLSVVLSGPRVLERSEAEQGSWDASAPAGQASAGAGFRAAEVGRASGRMERGDAEPHEAPWRAGGMCGWMRVAVDSGAMAEGRAQRSDEVESLLFAVAAGFCGFTCSSPRLPVLALFT